MLQCNNSLLREGFGVKKDKSNNQGVVIKKYPNRRLYNTETSSYIVLDDIVNLIKSDTDFSIIDTKTGEDITRSILNQIIFERETNAAADYHFPLEFQKQLIEMYDDTYGSMVPDYLQESLKLFAAERSRMNENVTDVIGKNSKSMLEFNQNLAKRNMELFKQSWQIFTNTNADSPKDSGSETGNEDEQDHGDNDSNLDDIQKQIDALQERLANLKSNPRK